jgi:hypothetical protein
MIAAARVRAWLLIMVSTLDDPEIAAYVQQLEEAKDTTDLPEATGDAIAKEFERYVAQLKPFFAGVGCVSRAGVRVG